MDFSNRPHLECGSGICSLFKTSLESFFFYSVNNNMLKAQGAQPMDTGSPPWNPSKQMLFVSILEIIIGSL